MTPSPLLITGCYRSGTSLLRLILNAHPLIHIPEETRYFTLIGPKLEEYIGLENSPNSQRQLISDIGDILERQGWPVIPQYDDLVDSIDSWTMPDIARAVNTSTCPPGKREGLSYWGDKTPDYLRSVFYLRDQFPDARFVIIMRDGRDVAASARNLQFATARNLESLGLEWNEALLNALLAERAMPDRVSLIRYEDLVNSPEVTVRSLCRFLEIEFDEQMLDFHSSRSAQSLSRESHHTQVAKPISNKSVGRFAKAFRPAEVARLERVMFAGLSTLGYSLDHSYQIPLGGISRYYRMSTNFVRLFCARGATVARSFVPFGRGSRKATTVSPVVNQKSQAIDNIGHQSSSVSVN